MKIRKAVIPAAGLGTRFLPATKSQPKEMLPIVSEPAIQYIVEEAVKSGIEEILIITNGNKKAIEDHFDKSYELEDTLKKSGKIEYLEMVQKISNLADIHYIRQKEPKGLGHAILRAKAFIGNEPFAVLLGDDVIVSEIPVISQLMSMYEEVNATVLGVQDVADGDVSKYGVVKKDAFLSKSLSKIADFVEKPSLEDAPSRSAVLGRYILSPNIFEVLETQEPGAGGEIQLTDAIKRLMEKEDVYAYNFEGERYDLGSPFGFIKANIDFALKDEELKDEVAKYLKHLSETLTY